MVLTFASVCGVLFVHFVFAFLLCVLSFCFFFFFSSRRRHTRCSRDWSSDVCSSDLLYRRAGEGPAQELLTWRVAQKYYFDPTFGGAIVRGQRNVFQALDSVTPFAFASSPRRFSPVVTDLRVTPGSRYDAEFRMDYDTQRRKLNALGTLVKMRAYREISLTLAHFSVQTRPVLQPKSNQIRGLLHGSSLDQIGRAHV